MSNFAAAETAINQLREQGEMTFADEVKAESVLSMAEALDTDPQNAALWRVYVAALSALLDAKAGEDTDVRDIFFFMRGAMGNT